MKLSVGDKIFFNGRLCPIETVNETGVVIVDKNGLHKSIPDTALENRVFEWVVEYSKGKGKDFLQGRSHCDKPEKAQKEKDVMVSLGWETVIRIEERGELHG